jgi:hypothetical protein
VRSYRSALCDGTLILLTSLLPVQPHVRLRRLPILSSLFASRSSELPPRHLTRCPAPRCRTRPFTLLTRRDEMPLGIVRFVRGGNHPAGHARPAGLTRLREGINSWLEETSFRIALAACATALLLIVAAVATALLVPGHGAARGHGTVPDAAPSDPAGTARASGAMPAVSPLPRATAVPSATPAPPDPAASPAASSTASVADPSRSATSSPPRCPPGHARHHRC